MQNVEFLVRNEQNKDLQRQAQNERLARQNVEQGKFLKNARHALGQGLVQVGQQLLNER